MTFKLEIILEDLRDMSSDKYKENVVKLGIPEENSLGVPTGELRKLAKKLPKELPKEKQLVSLLWRTTYHEARILSVLLMKPEDYSVEELSKMMKDVISWDLCDLFCKTVLINRVDFNFFIDNWIDSKELYFKRAAFTLIASMSTHAVLRDEDVSHYLTYIKDYSDDERLMVKKAVSWALRELGKIDEVSREKALDIANDLLESQSKSKKWIAKDALKELTTLVRVEGRSRLISNKSKMGKQVIA